MYAIIGLGNAGSEYEATRHNIGFAVVDALAEKFGVSFKRSSEEYVLGSITIYGERHVLVKPLTYMNNSGIAVQRVARYYHIPVERLLIVVDDFQIPLGSLRIRFKGSDGGHHGIASIISSVRSVEFPRIRCGIQGDTIPANKSERARYVLEPFQRKEIPIVKKMIDAARDAAIVAVTEGIPTAMNKFNSLKIS